MSQNNQFALGTFSVAGCAPFAGVVVDERVVAVNALASFFKSQGSSVAVNGSVLELVQDWDNTFKLLSAAVAAFRRGELKGVTAVDVAALRVHAPLQPTQILCTGANYRQHVVEYMVDLNVPEVQGYATVEEKRAHAERLMDQRSQSGRPYIFVKLPVCLTGPNDPIILPANCKQPDWELELAVIIGRPARHVSREKALDYVAGYTVTNDTSLRELLMREDFKAMGTDWLACKSSPSWSPLGPYLIPAAFVPNPHDLKMTLKLNGEVKQNAKTNDMIFDITRQIEYLSNITQLMPGDLICTGSPSGNGSHYKRFLQPGDVVESTIEGIGSQRNVCEAEKV